MAALTSVCNGAQSWVGHKKGLGPVAALHATGWPKHGQASAWHWLVLGPGLGRPWLALVGPRAWLRLPLLALTGLGLAASQGEEAMVK